MSRNNFQLGAAGMMMLMTRLDETTKRFDICPEAYKGCEGAKVERTFQDYCLGDYTQCEIIYGDK